MLHKILRLFYTLLYHDFAWSYDIVAWAVSVGKWREWTRQGLEFVVGPRVLELGHGPGHLQTELISAGLDVFGLDESHEMGVLAKGNIKNCRKITYHNGYAQFYNLVRGISQSIPLKSHSFNTVIATFPTEYIASLETLSEIRRMLLPGGRLVIVLGAWITGKSLPDRVAAWLFKVTGQAPDWQPEFSQPFLQAGFSVEHHLIQLRSSKVLVLIGSQQEIP